MKLQNNIAIVTGAANGIGRAIASALAAEGAAVLLADVDQAGGEDAAADIRKVGQIASFVAADVSDESQIARVVQLASARNNRIDILVNNAAWIEPWHDLESAPPAEWDRCYEISLRGSANFIRLALPHMLPHGKGSIVNISSVQGIVGAKSSPAYTSIKHALIGLTRSIAYDYGSRGIRCNAVCPGPIRTRISPPIGSELHQRQVAKTMLNRTGEVDEVAKAVAFLASEDASYITGAILAVDGGWTAM